MSQRQKGWKDKLIMNKKRVKKMTSVLYKLLLLSLVFLPFSFAAESAWSPEDELKHYLMNNYPWDDIEVTNVKVMGKSGDRAPERIIVEKGPLGRAVFVFVSENNKRNIVKASVRAFGQIVKSKRSFGKRHVIAEEDIYLAKMDVRKMPRSTVKDPDTIVGKSLKRSIMANVPVLEGMIESSRVVARGMRVVLLINSNGLTIRAAGKTKEKGYVGKPVRAVNLTSKREVSGVLIDDRTVEVEL